MGQHDCDLCAQQGGETLFRSEKWRVVLVNDIDHPGFCRVIWNEHVGEMTDLPPYDRMQFMQAVWEVEAAMRAVLLPDKINLASLGNMVPHLHWHVIARYADDAQFPAPIWAAGTRKTASSVIEAKVALLPQLRSEIVSRLKQMASAASA